MSFTAAQLTHAPKNLPIPAIAYLISTLDSQSSGHGRGRPNYFEVEDFFKKHVPLSMPFFEKKFHPILLVEGLKLCLDFLCNVRITYKMKWLCFYML